MAYTQQITRKYNKNEVIFRQGDPANCMFDVCKGSVAIYVDYGTPQEKRLTVIAEKGVFGELGLIECKPRSATAVALSNETELLAVSRETFQEYFRKQPVKVVRIMQNMSKRIRTLTQEYMDVCKTITDMDEQTENKEKTLAGRFLEQYIQEYHRTQELITNHPELYYDVHTHPWLRL